MNTVQKAILSIYRVSQKERIILKHLKVELLGTKKKSQVVPKLRIFKKKLYNTYK